MPAFEFTQKVSEQHYTEAALGVDVSNKLTEADQGKPVKFSGASTMVVCDSGDAIDGFVATVGDATVNQGFSHGSIIDKGRIEAVVGTVAVTLRGFVFAGDSGALNTATGTVVIGGATQANSYWQVIKLGAGAGATGDTVMLQRV